jgi:hypothetical protein
VYEERNVGTQAETPARQNRTREAATKEAIEREQDRGGVAAAAPEPGSDGDPLDQANVHDGREGETGNEESCRSSGKILPRG